MRWRGGEKEAVHVGVKYSWWWGRAQYDLPKKLEMARQGERAIMTREDDEVGKVKVVSSRNTERGRRRKTLKVLR